MTTDTVGGVWTYSLALARGLIGCGVEVTLALLGPHLAGDPRRQAAAIAGLRVEVIDGPLDWIAQGVAELQPVAAQLDALTRRARAEVIHLNTPSLAALSDFGAPVVGVCHSCESTWSEAMGGAGDGRRSDWRRQLRAQGYAACARLAAPSRAFAEATTATYGVPTRVVRNGCDASPATARPRERLVLAAGRFWDPAKDMATLDRTAAELDAPLVALGALDQPQGGVVQAAHARALGQATPEDVGAWMASAAVFVSCARYEPFGLAVLEAAHAGCALVLSDIASFRELWDGVASFAPVGDASAFARHCRRLLDDRDARLEAAEAASRRARRYSVAVQTEAMIALYAEVAPEAFAALNGWAAA